MGIQNYGFDKYRIRGDSFNFNTVLCGQEPRMRLYLLRMSHLRSVRSQSRLQVKFQPRRSRRCRRLSQRALLKWKKLTFRRSLASLGMTWGVTCVRSEYMKTFSAKATDIHRDWYIVDASDKILGRLATDWGDVTRRCNCLIKHKFSIN